MGDYAGVECIHTCEFLMNRSSITPRSTPPVPCQTNQRYLCGELGFQIDNLPHITAAYGAAAATVAEEAVYQLALDIIGDHGAVRRSQSGQFRVAGPRISKRAIYMLLRTLARYPVRTRSDVFHVVISVACDELSTREVIPNAALHLFGERPLDDSLSIANVQWIKRYRTDMAAAVKLYQTINDGHFEFGRRPVRYANSRDMILYHELIFTVDGCTDLDPSGDAAKPLKRLGLLRALELHVIERAIDVLAATSDLHLGINISIENAVLDLWWFNVCERLGSSPNIAQRLVFEVGGIERLPSSRDAVDFMTHIKRYGCQIALDNLGPENVSAWTSGAFSPDIAKIEAAHIQCGEASHCVHRELASLIGEAAYVSGLVIVQGIRTQRDSEFVSNLGCCWQQGPYFESPGN